MQLKENHDSPTVEVVRPDSSVAEAADKMRSLDVGSLPVCDGRRLVGMITDRDITIRATADGRDPNNTLVRDCMSPEIVYCFEDQDVQEDPRARWLPDFSAAATSRRCSAARGRDDLRLRLRKNGNSSHGPSEVINSQTTAWGNSICLIDPVEGRDVHVTIRTEQHEGVQPSYARLLVYLAIAVLRSSGAAMRTR
ncbi:MAG: CBS domain-containing protein [Verrucomicrobiota bacterium]|nr:CBS domain-containing protein [Verrucomicrobiota bacterium]